MAELSHRALRELIAGFGGCDEYYTEMISAGALVSGGMYEKWYLDNGPDPAKLVYQLAGNNAEHLANAAAFLDAYECAGIDINMGCSAPAIRRAGGGVQWMASIDKAAAMIALVRKRTARRLSVKLRVGLEDDFDYLLRFCKMLEKEGIERIALHPRTAQEKFKRGARWEYVALLRRELGIPVAGNGDIASAAELADKTAACDAVMAGRLAVRQPWVFAQARHLHPTGNTFAEGAEEESDVADARKCLPPSAVISKGYPMRIDLEDVGLRFLDLLAKYQPPPFHKSRAHRFFTYFCDNLKWANYVKTLLGREEDLSAMARALTGFFSENPEERYIQC
jgi:tRNA-dihydrouridine synthase